MKMIKAGIVGATGYTGVELLRLLAGHPNVTLHTVTSRAAQGKPVSAVFPSLRGVVEMPYLAPEAAPLRECDWVFFATPNGTAMQHAPALLEAGVGVIDLSADFRLSDKDVWERWYGQKHACPAYLPRAVYGLPELNRAQLVHARLIANPGCYPTAVQLGFLPLLESGLAETDSLVADVKSGISGAGRKAALGTHFCEVGESFSAYAAAGHRHLPEIRQGLSAIAGEQVDLTFVPHLLPVSRGIHATLYARLKSSKPDLHSLFARRYNAEPFVDVLPPGAHPDLASVRASNMCRLSVFCPQDGNVAVILAVEDNLVKGAAGQAIQNMNIACRLEETTGLAHTALVP